LTIAAAASSLALTLIWLYLPVPFWMMSPLLLVNGLCAGGMVLMFATAREHNPSWAAGATLGIVNMTVMGNGAIFQSLTGWLLDQGWTGELVNGARIYSIQAWQTAFLVLPGCLIASLIGALFVRETGCRPQK